MKQIKLLNDCAVSATTHLETGRILKQLSALITTTFLSFSAIGQNNIVKNPDFEQNVDDVYALTSGQIPPNWNVSFKADPNLILRVANDTPDGSGASLMVILPEPRSEHTTSGNYGLSIQTQTIPDNSVVRVSFDAKTISGSPYLNVKRPWGGHGVDARQLLTSDWEKYITEFDYHPTGGDIFFNLAPNACDVAYGEVAGGAFMIDNVAVEIVPANSGNQVTLTDSACVKESN